MTCSKQCLQTYPNFWATLAWQFRGSTIQIAQWIGETWLWIRVNWTLSNSGKMNLPKKDMTFLHVRWYCRGFPELLSFEKKKSPSSVFHHQVPMDFQGSHPKRSDEITSKVWLSMGQASFWGSLPKCVCEYPILQTDAHPFYSCKNHTVTIKAPVFNV